MGVYITPTDATIKSLFCVDSADFKMADATFDALLNKLATWAEAKMNTYMGRAYTSEEVAADPVMAGTFQAVAFQMIDNYLLLVQQRKNAGIVTVSDFKSIVQMPNHMILTEEMMKDLDPYATGSAPYPVFQETVPRFSSETSNLFTDTTED